MDHIAAMDTVCASLAFIDGLGAPEMVLIFIIVLVLFGGQKMPEFARGLGKSIRQFKKAASGVEEEFKRALDEDERKNTPPQIAAPVSSSTGTDSAGPDAHAHQPDEYHDYQDDYHSGTSDTPAPEKVAAADTPPAEPSIAAPAGTNPSPPPAGVIPSAEGGPGSEMPNKVASNSPTPPAPDSNSSNTPLPAVSTPETGRSAKA